MSHLSVGSPAPNLEAKNQRNEDVRLSDFRGKKVVLYFYPQDNTPTCTTEACNLRDNYQLLLKKGFVVLGISPDAVKKHQNFIKKFDLPFDLLADTELEWCNAFGVWSEKTTFGKTYMGVLRTTFIIDENGIIEEVIEKVESKRHSEQILK